MTEDNGGRGGRGQHLLFVWSPDGYELREVDGDPPAVGHVFEHEGHTLVVSKVGASPLPGDRRPCAYSIGRD